MRISKTIKIVFHKLKFNNKKKSNDKNYISITLAECVISFQYIRNHLILKLYLKVIVLKIMVE